MFEEERSIGVNVQESKWKTFKRNLKQNLPYICMAAIGVVLIYKSGYNKGVKNANRFRVIDELKDHEVAVFRF